MLSNEEGRSLVEYVLLAALVLAAVGCLAYGVTRAIGP